MGVEKHDIRRPDSEGGGFEERYWSPLNSPVFGATGKILYIIHRVEDVTDIIHLKQLGSEQHKLTEELPQRENQKDDEVFLRVQQLQEANRNLRAANEQLSKAQDELEARVHERTSALESVVGGVAK